MEFTVQQIAEYLGGTVEGDGDAKINDFAKIEEGREGALSFLSNPKYEHFVYDTRSTAVIVANAFSPTKLVDTTLIRVGDPYSAFAKLLELYVASKSAREGVSAQAYVNKSAEIGEKCYVGTYAVIEADAQLGDNVKIYPQVFIGERVKIGNNVIIYAGAKIYEECVIGDNVIIHSGAVIGADGFGFAPNKAGEYSKIPQIGNVVIEDSVEIGANTCIDRATMGSTLIKRGTKVDNLVQIAHNVVVGEHTVMAAQVGVAGTTKIGNYCMLGGQAGVSGHITIGDRTHVGSQGGVHNNLDGGVAYLGSPVMKGTSFHRSHAVFRNLPDLSRTVYALERQVKQLREELAKGEDKQE